jgi:hypothetical protein
LSYVIVFTLLYLILVIDFFIIIFAIEGEISQIVYNKKKMLFLFQFIIIIPLLQITYVVAMQY